MKKRSALLLAWFRPGLIISIYHLDIIDAQSQDVALIMPMIKEMPTRRDLLPLRRKIAIRLV